MSAARWAPDHHVCEIKVTKSLLPELCLNFVPILHRRLTDRQACAGTNLPIPRFQDGRRGMRQSMTGFASQSGHGLGRSWTWELRGVNGKGLDLRLRLPDGIDGLDAEVRRRAASRLVRGNVQIGLKLTADAAEGGLRLDPAQLSAVLTAMAQIESEAMTQGLSLAPSTAAQIVGLRGILTTEAAEVDPALLCPLLLSD